MHGFISTLVIHKQQLYTPKFIMIYRILAIGNPIPQSATTAINRHYLF